MPVSENRLLSYRTMNQKRLRSVSVFGIFMTTNFKVRNVEVATDSQGHTEYGSGLWLVRQMCSWDIFPTYAGRHAERQELIGPEHSCN
jgi:hypothetical protein